jgi:Fe-S cluster assembly protein SufD
METAVLEIEEPQTTVTPASILAIGPISPEQAEAWERFTALPMPKRTDETWRFANLKRLDLATYAPPLPVDAAAREELLSRSRGLESAAGRMVFGNDQLLAREILADTLRQ